MGAFLSAVDLPKLNNEQIIALESPVSVEELQEDVKCMPNRKVTGHDGFLQNSTKNSGQNLHQYATEWLLRFKPSHFLLL